MQKYPSEKQQNDHFCSLWDEENFPTAAAKIAWVNSKTEYLRYLKNRLEFVTGLMSKHLLTLTTIEGHFFDSLINLILKFSSLDDNQFLRQRHLRLLTEVIHFVYTYYFECYFAIGLLTEGNLYKIDEKYMTALCKDLSDILQIGECSVLAYSASVIQNIGKAFWYSKSKIVKEFERSSIYRQQEKHGLNVSCRMYFISLIY